MFKNLFSRKTRQQSRPTPTHVMQLSSRELTPLHLAPLALEQQTILLMAYVSPHLSIAQISDSLQRLLPSVEHIIAVQTAGELGGDRLYQSTDGQWDNIVLHAFSQEIFSQIEVKTVALHCEDIRSGKPQRTPEQRINAIAKELEKVSLKRAPNYFNTIVLTYFDGLSASENFFMQALYQVEKFPCYFIGGSGGGKLDFGSAMVAYNGKVIPNQALMVFATLDTRYRYGIFRTHNFTQSLFQLTVADFDANTRVLRSLYNPAFKTLHSV